MRILPPEEIVFGVTDLEACFRFAGQFGLRKLRCGADGGDFETLDGSRILVRSVEDAGLPPAVEAGSTLREIVFGVADDETLEAVRSELSRDRLVTVADERIATHDDAGLGIAFQVTKKRKYQAPLPAVNVPGNFQRPVNTRIEWEKPVHPIGIAHVVINCEDEPKTRAFYVERLGFKLSDSFTGQGAFIRTAIQREHHCLFTVQRAPTGLNHVAFYVADFHEVMLAGKAMTEQGWKTRWGPGRHKLGSNYFWYIDSPMGGAFEFTCDVDHVDDQWIPGEFTPGPEMTSIWSARDFIPH